MGGNKVGNASPSLTWWGLGAIAFVMTSCGPFGLEATMNSGGALLTFIAVLVVPILYVIPQVLMVSELALMMPSNHGYILWVQRGWGPFAGFFNGYNAVLVNTVDLALYPVLASDYVLRLFGRIGWVPENATVGNFDFTDRTYIIAIATRLTLIAIGTFVSCLSTANVSSISVIVCIIVVAVFVALFIWVVPSIDIAEQITYKAGLDSEFDGPQWGPFTAAALWLYTGWNSLGSLAGDVENEDGVSNSEAAAAAEAQKAAATTTDRHATGGSASGPLAPETIVTAGQLRDLKATEAHHAHRHVDGYYSPNFDENTNKAVPPELLTKGDLRALDHTASINDSAQEHHQTMSSSSTVVTVDGPAAPKKEAGLNNVFVRGLQFALVLGVILYVIPLLTCLTSEEARTTPWADGFLVNAMDMAIPGSFWVLITIGILSQFGLYYSSLVCYSRIVWGLAELGWLPSFLASLNETHGTPIKATLAQSLALVPLMFFDFSYLQRLEFTLAAIAYCLTFSAFLRLRYTEKETKRPYTVPGGLPVAWLITATKIVVMVTVAVTNAMDPILLGVTVGINIGIGIAYYFSDGRKRAKELEERERAAAEGGGAAIAATPTTAAHSPAVVDVDGSKYHMRASDIEMGPSNADLTRPLRSKLSSSSSLATSPSPQLRESPRHADADALQ